MAITFTLGDVEKDTQPLEGRALVAEIEARGVRGALAFEADGPLVAAPSLHGLVMAMHVAFAQHRPLVLSPDHVWLCVAQGLGRWVDAHAEELRPRLVRHAGKKRIEVRNDALASDPSSTAEWARSVDDLVAEVRKDLGGRADLFVCDFTTTTRAARAASSVALLGAMQQFFEYRVASLCGIPEVTLEGTQQDWADVRRRARVLGELDIPATDEDTIDLARWASELDPVLAKLEETAAGKPDLAFWRRAYKEQHASGGEAVSGWVNALLPFLGDEGVDRGNPWFFGGDDLSDLELPKLSSFPAGLASAPFTWQLLSGERAMRLVAGLVGVARAGDGVRPAIGWAVAPDAPARRFRAYPYGDGTTQLTPRKGDLASLAGLREEIAADGHTRARLSLGWCAQLRSLDRLEESPQLEIVSVMQCDALERIDAVAGAQGLREVHIAQCNLPIDLSPLQRLRGLEWLAVSHCPNVDLSALADVEVSKRLDLFGKDVPAEVQGRHDGAEAIARARAALRAMRR